MTARPKAKGARHRRLISAAVIGGMIASTIHVLLVTPLIFLIMKQYALRRGGLHLSGLRAEKALDQRE